MDLAFQKSGKRRQCSLFSGQQVSVEGVFSLTTASIYPTQAREKKVDAKNGDNAEVASARALIGGPMPYCALDNGTQRPRIHRFYTISFLSNLVLRKKKKADAPLRQRLALWPARSFRRRETALEILSRTK